MDKDKIQSDHYFSLKSNIIEVDAGNYLYLKVNNLKVLPTPTSKTILILIELF